MMSNPFEQAIDYHRHGLTPIPFETGTKDKPIWGSWKEYQDTPQSLSEVKILFYGLDRVNIALIGGVQGVQGYPFFVDCDNRQKAEAFENHLAGLGIETWQVQRDRFVPDDPHAGGQHFYMMADKPVKTKQGAFGEIRGRGAILIAPDSIHPTGATYQFKQQSPVIFRLDTLQAIPELELEVADENDNRQGLPRLAWKLLQGDSNAISTYKSRSEAEAALCASLIRAGCGYDEILALFVAHSGPGKFRDLHTKNPQKAQRYLYQTYGNALKFVRNNPSDTEAIAQRLMDWVKSQSWSGRTGATDKSVYMAHLNIVLRCGKASYGASVRELAELAGISWKTAGNANQRLIEAGLLELKQKHTASLSNIWSIVDCVPSLHTQSVGCDGVCNKETFNVNPNHDVFRWSGLGKTGADIYNALLELREATPQEIIQRTKRGRATIYKKLDRMEKLNMAERIGRGKWQALEVNLDIVAKMLGTSGQGEWQQQKHIQERRLHHLILKRGADKS